MDGHVIAPRHHGDCFVHLHSEAQSTEHMKSTLRLAVT